MTSKVELAESEHETTKKLYELVSVYLGKQVLPEFKKDKL
jgi:hypothetical protein